MTNRSLAIHGNDYALTERIGHIHLNHLLINKSNHLKKNIVEAGYIRRIRSKFVTIIYISPKGK